ASWSAAVLRRFPRDHRTHNVPLRTAAATPLRRYAIRPQQFLYFLPLPQGHGSLRPTLGNDRRIGRSSDTSPAPSPSPSPPTAAIAPTGWRMRASAVAVGAVGPSSRRRNCGNVARKFSNACRLEVLRKRLLRTSF